MTSTRRRTALAVAAAAFLLAGCTSTSDTASERASDSASTSAGTVVATASPAPEADDPGGQTDDADPSPTTASSPVAGSDADESPADTPADTPAETPAETPAPATPAASPSAGSAQALLATLAVKGRAPLTGYDRDEYGQAWADVDRN